MYTNYDRLLKTTSFHEARSLVEEPTLARLVEWRGDDENGKKVLEDVFREVIVISDDEDSDTEEEETIPSQISRDHSVEIVSVSSNPRAEELHTKPLDYENPSTRKSLHELSDDEAPPGFRFIPESPKLKKSKIDRRGFSRYKAWDRAINRYRNHVAANHNREIVGHQRFLHQAPRPPQEGTRMVTQHPEYKAVVPPPLFTPYTGPDQRSAGGRMMERLPAPRGDRVSTMGAHPYYNTTK